jgi:hypothetical protein
MSGASPKPRSVFSAICRSNGIILGRMRATVGSRFSQNASRASASHFQSAAYLPILQGSGRLLTARIERTQSQRALLAVSAFTKRGRAWFSNLGRCQTTTGKCFFLSALIHDANQSERGLFHSFVFSPVLSFFAARHVKQHDSRRDGNVRIEIGEVRNVVR